MKTQFKPKLIYSREPKEITLDFPFGTVGIWGGPWDSRNQIDWRKCDPILFKLNKTSPGESDYDFFIQDFGVPTVDELEAGVTNILLNLYLDYNVFVGCSGGLGRTGLILGVLARVADDSRKKWYLPRYPSKHSKRDPVNRIRSLYQSAAVETKAQEQLLRQFKTDKLVALSNTLYVPRD